MSGEQLNPARSFGSEFVFESYGVRVKIQAADSGLLDEAEQMARKAVVDRLTIIENITAEHTFGVTSDPDGTLRLLQNGVEISSDLSRTRFFKFFNSMLRIVIAEHALDRVFIHAGVVGWKGRAIIIPADSFRGKTTLVSELVRIGAEYYSDEYAVLDESGLVHPFPRDLSVRDANYNEADVPVENFGGTVGIEPIPVGTLLLTEYVPGAVFDPETMTIGHGIMKVIPHTIPRNFNTEFSLKVLNTALSDAIILRTSRGEANAFAEEFLAFIDNISKLAKIT